MTATEWGIVISVAVGVPAGLMTPFAVLILRALWGIRDQLSTLTEQMASTRKDSARGEKDRTNIWGRLDKHTEQIGDHARDLTAVDERVKAIEGQL